MANIMLDMKHFPWVFLFTMIFGLPTPLAPNKWKIVELYSVDSDTFCCSGKCPKEKIKRSVLELLLHDGMHLRVGADDVARGMRWRLTGLHEC